MRKQGHGIPIFSSQLTATISVALVLLIIGIVALMAVASHTITRDIRSNVGFVAIMSDTATPTQINTLKRHWMRAPYTASVKYSSADDVLKKWADIMDEDYGDDVTEMLGVNPFFPEFEVTVKETYANSDSLERIIAPLRSWPGISDIVVHTEMIDSLNSALRSLSLILIAIATALLIISFVLINNTIRLTVYSRRFIIHTMKLVGATRGFIRKPFIIDNILHGTIAGIIAIAALAAMLYYLAVLTPQLASTITWQSAAWVFVGLLLLGIAICSLAALFATNKYLRSDYDRMFK